MAVGLVPTAYPQPQVLGSCTERHWEPSRFLSMLDNPPTPRLCLIASTTLYCVCSIFLTDTHVSKKIIVLHVNIGASHSHFLWDVL